MLIPNQYFHRFAAFSMAIFGLYVFIKGVNTNEYKVLDDGSLISSSEGNVVCLKHTKTILTFKAGFDAYRSIGYGLSSFFLLIDLLLNSGYLTLPALILSAGEIVNDFSDFCLAVVVLSVYIGGYPAAAYGLTYFTLLVFEVLIWLGTCKFHETCRIVGYENKLLRKRQQEMNQTKKIYYSIIAILLVILFLVFFVDDDETQDDDEDADSGNEHENEEDNEDVVDTDEDDDGDDVDKDED